MEWIVLCRGSIELVVRRYCTKSECMYVDELLPVPILLLRLILSLQIEGSTHRYIDIYINKHIYILKRPSSDHEFVKVHY